jgi:hypothetical protein
LGEFQGQGAEHQVFLRLSDNRMVKRTYPGTFGVTPDIKGNQKAATPLFYLHRLELMNRFFGSDIRMEGVQLGQSPIIGLTGEQPAIVTSQPAIRPMDIDHPHPSPAEIRDFMQTEGFRPKPSSYFGWERPDDGVTVLDARPDNFIKSQKGVVPVDLVIDAPPLTTAVPGESEASPPSFSAGERLPVGIPRDQVQNVAAGLNRDFPRALPTMVHATAADLPPTDLAKLQAEASAQGVDLNRIKGAAMEGKVHLFANNLASPSEAQSIWLHEQAGHFAMDAVLGPQLRGFMGQVAKSFADHPVMQDVQWMYPGADAVTHGREFVAKLAQNPTMAPNTWQRLVATTRTWLRGVGLVRNVSENDIRVLLQRATESLRRPSNATGAQGEVLQPTPRFLDMGGSDTDISTAAANEFQSRPGSDVSFAAGRDPAANEWGKYDLSDLRPGSDPIKEWRSFPRSETSIRSNESNPIPETSEGIREWAKNELAKLPRRVISPWGKEVNIHQVADIKSRAAHYVAGQTSMAASYDRAEILPMLAHTIKNAMAYATTGIKGRAAYLYRYADGSLHVVIVDPAKGAVERQFIQTQYPHDASLRDWSDLRVLYRNGI